MQSLRGLRSFMLWPYYSLFLFSPVSLLMMKESAKHEIDFTGQDCEQHPSFLLRKMGTHHCKGGLETMDWGLSENSLLPLLHPLPMFVYFQTGLINRQFTRHC